MAGRLFRMLFVLLFCLLINCFSTYSQSFNEQKNYFIPPVKIPIYLSGNFGEIRTNHFHSGIDIKTQGVTGHKIYACADGYVSRIKIRGNGYGKAVYIKHPNGYTTVYGHLDRFNKKIHEYITSKQYLKQSFEIDVYLPVDRIMVNQGEVIAYSGNSGSSSGPHLHFEIRDLNQKPQNVLNFNFPVIDNIPPVIKKINIYPLDEQTSINGENEKVGFKAQQQDDIYVINEKPDIHGKIGIGIETYDYLNGSRNRCGIYSIELLFDGIPVYHHTMNEFSFAESRYINAHIDYEERINERKSIHKTFLLPHNNLSIYKTVNKFKHGININDTLIHEIEIIVNDVYSNKSILKFNINSIDFSIKNIDKNIIEGKLMLYDQINIFNRNDIVINFPAYCFYENIHFNYAKTFTKLPLYSPIHHLHQNTTPLHKTVQLSLRAVNLPDRLRDKALIARVNGKNMLIASGGQWEDGFVTTKINAFGKYVVAVDTIKPTLIPGNISKGKNMQKYKSIRFYMKDNLSGIKSYNGYINNEWALFEYDPKKDLLYYLFDENRLDKNKTHTLEMIIEDYHHNRKTYHTQFYW